MNVRLAIALAAASISFAAPSHAEPYADAASARGFEVVAKTAGGFAIVYGWTDARGATEICAFVHDATARRYEHGCGTGSVDVDPLLRNARARGTIDTEVMEAKRRSRRIGASQLVIDVTLEGDGLHQTYQGAEAWNALPGAPGAGAYGGMWRAATSHVQMRSERLCVRARRCTSDIRSDGQGGSMWSSAFAFVAGEGGGECAAAELAAAC